MWTLRAANDELAGELEPGIPTPHEDPGLFGTEAAAVTLLYGLVAFGQIQLRRITGHQHVARIDEVIENAA